MKQPGPHGQEALRLAVLQSCRVLGTPPEPDFDNLARLAATIARAPISLVNLVAETHTWFKAQVGLGGTSAERDTSFCGHVIELDGELIVEDARVDERFAANPFVGGAPNVLFYAGFPLRVSGQRLPIGTLCVIDHAPRTLDALQLESLRTIARQVEILLENRLRERALEHAASTAESATRAKSEFLATMSHELRTPMNGVIGMTDLLLSECVDPVQRERLGIVRDSARALLSLINDVLDYSKIEAGARSLSPEPVSLAGLVRDVASLLAPEFARKGVRLELAVDAAASTVWADADATRQVLFNLIGNALKFTAKGAVRVATKQDGQNVSVRVEDDGIGIRAEDLPRLFKRFSQAESSTSRRFGGTGLGLAICKGLVDGMLGTISVTSVFGEGSVFTVRLPAAPEGLVALPVSLQPKSVARAMEVLLVEDNPVNQRVGVGMLRKLGHQVQLARDGREGVAAARSGKFDLILMDVQMPELDGLEATQQIRAFESDSGLRRAPIYALTASVLSEQREACLEAGMDQVLEKPLTLESLERALGELAAA
ncbi:MAG TPA: ATP-binding protein [Archangium sp.]